VRAAVASKVPSAYSLEEEVSAIDRARRGLAGGDWAGALQAVDAYVARLPAGALGEEAAEIRIEALYRSGKKAQADKLSTQVLAAHPTSLYARSVRALQAAAAGPPKP
jgi:hypothetical protein